MPGEMTSRTTAVRIGEITLDDRAWPREALDEERVELFEEMLVEARAGAGQGQGWTDPLPPLVVVADGQGGYVLADGRHRYEARRRLGAEFGVVQAAMFLPETRPPADVAYELGLRFATVSAKPLTSAEKRAAIQRLLKERPDLSDRAIARLIGVSNSTVSSYRRALCDPHTAGKSEEADDVDGQRSSAGPEPMRWEVAARALAEDVDDLLASCRRLFGGPDFKSAGRELYDALADLYGDEDALEVVEELGAIVGNAHARARKVAQVE